MVTQIAHDAIVMEPISPVLVVLAVIGLIAFWLDERRSTRALRSLRAGRIPSSWEAAYRKAHPNGPPDSDDIPPV